MSLKLIYSIDTSAILDGWWRFYPPDVFPKLWEKLDELINVGELKATEVVLFELERKDDEVYDWVKNRPKLFIPIDIKIQEVVSNILQDYERLVDTRKNRTSADAFVIALALINEACVITGELPSNNINKPKIPDVCRALGIRYINLVSLMREQGWVFNL